MSIQLWKLGEGKKIQFHQRTHQMLKQKHTIWHKDLQDGLFNVLYDVFATCEITKFRYNVLSF